MKYVLQDVRSLHPEKATDKEKLGALDRYTSRGPRVAEQKKLVRWIKKIKRRNWLVGGIY
jgi:hypothetical protein